MESRTRLTGLKLIAQYLEVQLWELLQIIEGTAPSDDPLPLFKLRPNAGPNARWHVFLDELDAWLDRRSQRVGGWGKGR